MTLPSPPSAESTQVQIIRRQFEPALTMFETLIRTCPETLWVSNPYGHPLWKRCLHAFESLDYFLNDFGVYCFEGIDKEVSPEFDQVDRQSLTRQEMVTYFSRVREKLVSALSNLTSDQLQAYSVISSEYTYLDIFLLQLRHLSLNLGCCDEVLAVNGYPRIGWTGYKE